MRHIGPVGPRHQLCDLAEVQPRLRLRARLVRELAARSALRGDGGGLVPISRPQVPWSVPSFFSAPRCAARRPWTRRSTTPCLLRIDCRTSEPTRRRIHNGCPSLHKHANRGGRCTRWRRRIAAAASRLTCRCLRPASGESASFRSKRCDTPTPRHLITPWAATTWV